MSAAAGPRRGSGNPAPRPALRKAADADVHPAVPATGGEEIVSLHGTTADAVRTKGKGSRGPAIPPGAGSTAAAAPGPAVPPGQGARTPAPAAPPPAAPMTRPARGPVAVGDLHGRRGAVTSDSIRRRKEKQVDLKVAVPKSLRQALRAQAKAEGRSVDDLVTAALRDALSRARTT